MRFLISVLLLSGTGAGLTFAQSLTEGAAAAAGGSVGGVAGKKVSDGLTAIFGKVDEQTRKAAKAPAKAAKPASRASAEPQREREEDSSEPLFESGPGVPGHQADSVPPPPPLPHHRAVHKAVAVVLPQPEPEPAPAVAPPPPPEMTADELRSVTPGTPRQSLLKMGEPASRITMYEDGHLVEQYLYLDQDSELGEVRLSDGHVSTVDLR